MNAIEYGEVRNTYAKKACKHCGVRHPQPEMIETQQTVDTGTSHRGFMWRNLFGAGIDLALKAEGSRKRTGGLTAMKGVLFGNHKRKYRRHITVWLCPNCYVETLSPHELVLLEQEVMREGIEEYGSIEAFEAELARSEDQ